jgi:adenine phosphoribosyltransferase
MTAGSVDRRSELARTEARDPLSLASLIRSIPDFPKPGIVFRDITPLLADPAGLCDAVDALTELTRDLRPDMVIGAEARGFLLGPALAREHGAGFVLARKPGSLPHRTIRHEYALEYASSVLEVHEDAIAPGMRVLVHDGEVVGCAFLIELAFLPGREALAPHEARALIRYDSE